MPNIQLPSASTSARRRPRSRRRRPRPSIRSSSTWPSTATKRPHADVPAARHLRDPRVYVGEVAEQQYLLSQPARGRRNEFFSNFKPHIHQSPRCARSRWISSASSGARNASPNCSLRNANRRRRGRRLPGLLGREAASRRCLDSFRTRFPPAFAIPEPVGAAFYFLGTQLQRAGLPRRHRGVRLGRRHLRHDDAARGTDGFRRLDDAGARRSTAGAFSTTCSING